MHNPGSALENETHKIQWHFERLIDHQISTKQPDFEIVKKKKKRTCRKADFAVPAEHRVKLKESEKRDKYLDLAIELKKVEHESNCDTNSN